MENKKIEVYEWDRVLKYDRDGKCRNYVQTFVFSDEYEKKLIKEGKNDGSLLQNWKKFQIVLKKGVVIQKEIYEWENGKTESYYEIIFANI